MMGTSKGVIWGYTWREIQNEGENGMEEGGVQQSWREGKPGLDEGTGGLRGGLWPHPRIRGWGAIGGTPGAECS